MDVKGAIWILNYVLYLVYKKNQELKERPELFRWLQEIDRLRDGKVFGGNLRNCKSFTFVPGVQAVPCRDYFPTDILGGSY